jgi:DNA-binding NarL/FixJ family response regulator
MKDNKHQILIGYSLKLFCDGLESLIKGFDEFTVVKSLPYNYELIELIKELNDLDILIIELNCPTKYDLALVHKIIDTSLLMKILLISNKPRSKICSNLIESGISAYLLKTCTKHDLLLALNKIIDNKNFYCSEITKAILHENHQSSNELEISLSEREKEILGMLINCKTNNQIALNLGLSENTIKTHRRNIHNKFGVNNLIGMVRYACRANLINFGQDDFCIDCPHCS